MSDCPRCNTTSNSKEPIATCLSCGSEFENDYILDEDPTRIDKLGNKYWLNKNGARHRDGAPAVVCVSGLEAWYQNGKYHREDGPAVIFPDGSETYYLYGRKATRF